MTTTVTSRRRPPTRGLGNRRPARTLIHVESEEARRRRLAMLARNARHRLELPNAQALADLTAGSEAPVSKRTVERLESPDGQVPRPSTMNSLEDALGLPLGWMQRVLDGHETELPESFGHRGRPSESDEKMYSKSDLRVLARALGADGLYSWVMNDPQS